MVRIFKKSKGEFPPSLASNAAALSPQKRGPGKRAGVTLDKIVQAAHVLVARGSGALNVKLVAEELSVTHGSIGEKLRRADTSLEQELAKQFLASILRPHAPGDKWRHRVIELFDTAVVKSAVSPALTRLVIPFLSKDPLLDPEFSDRLLYILRDAGLSPDDCALGFDIVLAGLCGTLTLVFPDIDGDALAWAKKRSKELHDVQQDRWSSLHYAAPPLDARASAKAASTSGKASSEMTAFAATMAGSVVGQIEAMHLKANL